MMDRALATFPGVDGGRQRGRIIAAEVVVAVVVALGLALWAQTIEVDPLVRIGQISGLAALQSAFALVAGGALLLIWVTKWLPIAAVAVPVAAAALSGAVTGVVAGGVQIALRGTPWGLFANHGDAGRIAEWAQQVLDGTGPDMTYPPGFIWALAGASLASGEPPEFAIKSASIAATALIGPVGYLAWRVLARPLPALMLGVVAALPLIDPYKPVTNTTLVVLVPVLIWVVRSLRRVPERTRRWAVVTGTRAGIALGVIGLMYSGWFAWSALGAAALFAFNVDWRSGWAAVGRSGLLLAVSGAVCVAVAGVHLVPLLFAGGAGQDTYFYFDVLVDPAFIAMWQGDLPGGLTPWPPPGELGGVGLFTLVLALGLAGGIALRGRSATVQTAVLLGAGAWVMRHKLAASMFALNSVQLWPRTTPEILYCLLVVTVVAGGAVIEGFKDLCGRAGVQLDARLARLGAVAALALVLAMAGSSLAEAYMPADDGTTHLLAWRAHTVNLPDGSCPATAPQGECRPR